MDNIKVYVSVSVDFDDGGNVVPKAIMWENGHKYIIDRVFSVFPSVSRDGASRGDCYSIRIGKKESRLFFERSGCKTGSNLGRWFVEKKVY